MHDHLLRLSVFLLFLVLLSSCSAGKAPLDSISEAYNLAQSRLFSREQKIEVPAKEEPVVVELRQRLQDSEKEREMLSNDIKLLERELRKKELAILLHGKIIKLLDDSNNTLQKKIEEQIAAQNFDDNSTLYLEGP